jgi:L-lactate dehydrogenase (cytochrome)
MSTVSVCPIEEVQPELDRPIWFQLYVLKDRGFMKNALERAWAAGVRKLVFTVDMPVPGARYRDAHSGMSGPFAAQRRILQAITHPRWAWDVGLMGHPHDLGNVSAYLRKKTTLEDYVGWLGANFDPRSAGAICNGCAISGKGRWCSRAFSTPRMRAMRCALARMASWFPTMAGANWMACSPPRGPCR